jgi:D-3-phosphoglycerate dehydrogenase
MEAWRTSCPRLPVWETATDRGYLRRKRIEPVVNRVIVTEAGFAFLRENGRIDSVVG